MAEYYTPPPPGVPYGYCQSPPTPPPPGAAAPQQQPPPLLLPYMPQQQAPRFAPYVAHFPSYGSYDAVRTLFVAGLPEDVKAREIYNLFREFPGYESSHLRNQSRASQPFAFAIFSDQQSAIVAMQALNGMMFDLEKGSILYIDLAKSNSRSKRSRTDNEWNGLDKKARGSFTFSRGAPNSGFGSVHMPGMGNSAYNMIGYPPTQSLGNFEARATSEITAAKLIQSSASPHVPKIGTPCPTLFVANLGPTCTEQELVQVFSGCPGFLKLKMQGTYGAPVAFIDFQDTSSSTAALSSLQGTVLNASPGGIRLEYAKSRMGMPRKPK